MTSSNNCPSISHDLLLVSIKALNVILNHRHTYGCSPKGTAVSPHGFAHIKTPYIKIVIKSITIDITDTLFIIKSNIGQQNNISVIPLIYNQAIILG